MHVDAQKASEMIERYEAAVIKYEQASADFANAARHEKFEARKALFDALTGGSDA